MYVECILYKDNQPDEDELEPESTQELQEKMLGALGSLDTMVDLVRSFSPNLQVLILVLRFVYRSYIGPLFTG